MAESRTLLLDDFTGDPARSSFGTSWRGFTDRVMGGVSDMQASVVDTDRGPALRMTGQVRLDNNGGFIQVRLPLERDGQPLDATGFDAVRVLVRGDPGAYFLHLRTPDARRPWQYYRAMLAVDAEWTERIVPLNRFAGKSIGGALDLGPLTSIAVVAYGEAFDPRIELARIELITQPTGPTRAD